MRQIKFRALSMCKGERWVYGDLRHYNRNPHAEKWTIHDPDTGLETDIDERTIGQYTGMHDKSDKEIYEGDILRSPSGNIVAVEFGYKEHIVKHGRPYITDSFACYGWIARNVKNGITDFFDNEFAAGEVVGNIHDNPELINQR